MKSPKLTALMPLTLLCLAVLADVPRAQTVVLQGGIEDGFALPADPASPSAELVAVHGPAIDDFDVANINRNVLHTFAALPCGIVAAELEFEVRGLREGVESDGVALGFADAGSASYGASVAWARNFGPFAGAGGGLFADPDPGLQPIAWGVSSQHRFVLDLSALPLATGGTLNLLPELEAHGFLDVLAGDDSTADFFKLTLTVDPAAATTVYCTAGTSASGCQASLSATGLASSVATSGFTVTATGVEGSKDGLFFFATNGRQANTWGNGTSFQCVVPPVIRAGLQAGTGSVGQCDGVFARDFNALWCATCPNPAKNPGPGAHVQVQLWYRDPFNTSNQTTSLSNALEFCVAP